MREKLWVMEFLKKLFREPEGSKNKSKCSVIGRGFPFGQAAGVRCEKAARNQDVRVRGSRWGRIEKVLGFPSLAPLAGGAGSLLGSQNLHSWEGSVSNPKGLLREVYPLLAPHLDK